MNRFPDRRLGRVAIVGAGPGDPDLITVRGLRYLQQADVVVYDRLVHTDLLHEAPFEAERIDVGKVPGRHPSPQPEINALLIARAGEGKQVVRLKGGDPFVLGRGAEECQALASVGIPFVVVPGISAAIAAPAYAGIPVTHRDYASSFAVVTGHTCETGAVDWQQFAGVDTLVVLMGVGRLPDIVRQLLACGRDPETPAAVIRWGTTTAQREVYGTLRDIADRACSIRPPATIVIGQVVNLHHAIAWFEPDRLASLSSVDTGGLLPSPLLEASSMSLVAS